MSHVCIIVRARSSFSYGLEQDKGSWTCPLLLCRNYTLVGHINRGKVILLGYQ